MEDYRWEYIKKDVPAFNNPFVWACFDLFFICIFQLGLIMLQAAGPMIFAWNEDKDLDFWDYFLFVLMFTLIAIETITDQQQWDFQTEKYRRKNNNEPLEGDYARGFCTSGLFAWSRHPNMASEVTIWWVFYFIGVNACGEWVNFSIIAPVVLTSLIFQSASLTERISLEKYPAYAEYQLAVPKLWPYPGGYSKDTSWISDTKTAPEAMNSPKNK